MIFKSYKAKLSLYLIITLLFLTLTPMTSFGTETKSVNIFAVEGYEQHVKTNIGDEIKVYAEATGYTNPEFQFFVRTPADDNWDMPPAQEYSENNHFTFSDTNQEGRYYFVVWVKEAGTPGNTNDPVGRGGFDDVAWTPGYPYLIGDAPMVTPGSLALSVEPDIAEVGETITLTANDYSGVEAEYKFYVKEPGGEWDEFNPDRDWDKENTFTYKVMKTGNYQFSVWARAVGETVERFDTWAWIPGVTYPTDPDAPDPLVVPDEYSTIQEAIDASWHGDVIMVKPGTYKENIDFKGRNITLRSTDPEDPNIAAATIIDGDSSGTVVTFSSGESQEAKLWGFTITGGDSGLSRGGGISISNFSSPVIKGNVITGNTTSRYGGGVSVSNESQPTFEENTFSANSSSRGAGIYVTDKSAATITNNTFKDHEVGDGVIHIAGSETSADITGNTIDNNTSDYGSGGVIITNKATAAITNNEITNNVGIGDNSAGAISVTFESAADIIDNIITGNKGSRVGAVRIYRHSNATISGNTITGNEAGLQIRYGVGGGISVSYYGEVEITGNTISDNKAWNNNHSGGGIAITSYGQETKVTISDNEITNNQGYRLGGGIYVGGSETTVLIKNNTISRNKAEDNDTAEGGGIYLYSAREATIYGNTISDNWAERRGGGIYIGRDVIVKGEGGVDWNRMNCPTGSEGYNTYIGNAHGDDRYGGRDVFFLENIR